MSEFCLTAGCFLHDLPPDFFVHCGCLAIAGSCLACPFLTLEASADV